MGSVLLLALAVVLAAAVYGAYRMASRRWPHDVPRALSMTALAAAVGTGLVALPILIADRGGVAGVAATVVPPLVITGATVVGYQLRGHGVRLSIGWGMTVAMFAFVVIYGLGLGLFYLPTALLVLGTTVAELGRERGRMGGGTPPVRTP